MGAAGSKTDFGETIERQAADRGMDAARLNFAHGSPDQHAETVERIRAAASAAGRLTTTGNGDEAVRVVLTTGRTE